jgi:REP element-mobilizing transposase RayT
MTKIKNPLLGEVDSLLQQKEVYCIELNIQSNHVHVLTIVRYLCHFFISA